VASSTALGPLKSIVQMSYRYVFVELQVLFKTIDIVHKTAKVVDS